jgi:hypothetical protein
MSKKYRFEVFFQVNAIGERHTPVKCAVVNATDPLTAMRCVPKYPNFKTIANISPEWDWVADQHIKAGNFKKWFSELDDEGELVKVETKVPQTLEGLMARYDKGKAEWAKKVAEREQAERAAKAASDAAGKNAGKANLTNSLPI